MCGKVPKESRMGDSIKDAMIYRDDGHGGVFVEPNDMNAEYPKIEYRMSHGGMIVEPNDMDAENPKIEHRMSHPEEEKRHKRRMQEIARLCKQNNLLAQNLKPEAEETVNHPDHYNSKGIEAIDVIRAFDLSFSLGNVIKYVLRAGRKNKDTYLEDLKKAKWYLDDEIRHVEPIPQATLNTR